MMILIDGPCKHHEEGEQDIEVVRLVESFVDLGQKLAENVGAGLIVEFIGIVEFRLLLLGVEIYIGVVEVTFHVNLFQSPVVVKSINVRHEIAEAVDTVSSDVLCVTVTIVHLFLQVTRTSTCFGRPRREAYSERGFIT